MSENQPRKKQPGDWLLWRVLDRLMPALVLGMMGLVWWLAVALVWFAQSLTLQLTTWGIVSIVSPGIAFLLAAGIVASGGRGGWKIEHMLKGADAEARIGHAIEYALTREGCAVAHNVMLNELGVDADGDIDHLVATPQGLWVIETKARRVPKKYFNNALSSIALSVKNVRKWAPDVRVTGCIAFANDPGSVHADYDAGGESIRGFANPLALARALRHESREEGGSKDLAARVWKLSVGDVAED